MKRNYQVQGMSCMGCARSLKDALARQNVEVPLEDIDWVRGTLSIDQQVAQEQVFRAIEAAGFTCTEN
jgi:copper chaperone CopZ